VLRHRAPGGLDLTVGHPRGLHRLQPVVTESHRGAACGNALAPAAVHLAVLDSLRDQHSVSPILNWLATHQPSARLGRAADFLAGAFVSALAFGAALAVVGAGVVLTSGAFGAASVRGRRGARATSAT